MFRMPLCLKPLIAALVLTVIVFCFWNCLLFARCTVRKITECIFDSYSGESQER